MKENRLKKSVNNLKKRLYNKAESDSSEHNIYKNMAKLTAGTGLAKIVGVITAPIITRIYLPEDMGVLSIFIAVITIIVPLGTLKYSLTIPLPRNDGLATNIVFFSSAILLLFTTMLFFILLFFAEAILGVFNVAQIVPYWWLLPIGVFGTAFYEILTNWAIREKAYKQYAKTILWQAIIGAITKISLGILGIIPLGLLIGQIFKQAGGIFALTKAFFEKLKNNFKYITKSRLLFIVKRYADFPKYRLPAQFLLVLATKSPLLFFAWHFSVAETGQLGLAFTMLAIPMSLFGATTAKAYYGEIAKLGSKKHQQIYKVTLSITKKLFLFALFPFLLLLLFGPWLFENFFGDVWREAGVYASILAVYLLTQFIYTPIGNGIFNVFNKQSLVLILNILRFVLIGSVFFITYYMELSTYISLGLYSLLLSVFYIIVIFIVFRIINKK